MTQLNQENKIKELLLLLERKHLIQQDLWEVLGVWNEISDGQLTKNYRHGRPANNLLINKQLLVPLEKQ